MSKNTEQELFSELEAAVQKQLAEESEAHSEMIDTIQELNAALKTLEEREASRREASTTLSEATAQRLERVKSTVDDNLVDGSEAEGRLEGARTRIQELEGALNSAESSAKRLEAAEEHIAQLQRELDEQTESAQSANAAKKRITKLEKALSEQAEALQAGQAAKRRVAELETTVEEYKQAAHAEQERANAIEEGIEELKNSEEQAREALASHEREQAGQEEAAAASTEKVATLDSELSGLREQLLALESELERARDEALNQSERADALDVQLTEQIAACEEAEGRASSQGAEQSALESELTTLRSQVQELTDSEQSLREAASQTVEQIDGLQSAAAEAEGLRAKTEELEGQLESAEDRIAHLKEDLEHEHAKGTKSILAEQLAEALKDTEAARNEVRTLREEVSGRDSGGDGAGVQQQENGRKRRRYSDTKNRTGQLLIEAGVITAEQLETALEYQQQEPENRHLGQILVELGMAPEECVAQAIAKQSQVDFTHIEVGMIDEACARLINARLAEKHHCIPICEEDGCLLLAMDNPLDLIAIEDVERASEMQVKPVVATRSAIESCIREIYDAAPQGS